MKLYLSKAGVWEAPGKQSKGAEKIDVPTTTDGLVDFLNKREAPPEPEFDEVEPAPPPPPTPSHDVIAAKVSAFKTNEILEFILDHASVSQVERIFACIGTRFGELVKGNRA